MTTHWALPQLLRAFWQGHPSHRTRILRQIASLDDDTLSREPVLGAFRRALHGSADDLARRVGELVSARGLVLYTDDLVKLLAHPQRATQAASWLRRARFPFPQARLLGFLRERGQPASARLAALRLLRRRASLSRAELEQLLPLLAQRALHPPLLQLLEPHADERLLEAAIAANEAYGRELMREQRARAGLSPEPGFFWRLFFVSESASSLGEFSELRQKQHGFVVGIAKLAIAAASQEVLAALLPYLFDAELREPLRQAYLDHEVTRVAAPLFALTPSGHVQRATQVELLGALGATQARTYIASQLPTFGRLATQVEQAAIVALARLGEQRRVTPFLQGALAAVREQSGEAAKGTPGHPTTWAPAFEAAVALKDERFAQAALDVLSKPGLAHALAELHTGLADWLVAFAPLELEPTVARVLEDERASEVAQGVAAELVRRCRYREQLATLVRRCSEGLDLAPATARALTELLTADDHALVRRFFTEVPSVPDAAASELLERCEEVYGAEQQRDLAQALLDAGAGGPRAQRRALALLGAGDPQVFLGACAALLKSPHGKVVTAGLRAGIGAGLLDPAHLADRPALGSQLGELVQRILQNSPSDTDAHTQLTLLLDVLVPKAGVPDVFEAEEAETLRQRIRQIGVWTELPTFMSFHRECLDFAAAGHDMGLLHGGLLRIVSGRRFLHPILGKVEPYAGPLPRFDETFASPSPFVQDGLFAVVCGRGYLRPQRTVLRFLHSPRARVRAGALGLVTRDACLSYSPEVLPSLADPEPEVRLAALDLLSRHEFARFQASARPLLDDVDEPVRLAATRVLGAWGDPTCVERLAGFLASDRAEIRREAAQALGRYEPVALEGQLAALVSTDAPRTAAAALFALDPERLPADEELRGAIFALAATGRGPLRGLALRFLPALADARRLGEVVPLLADARSEVRAAASYVLARRDGRKHAAAIARLASETKRTVVRLEVLGLLAALGVSEAARGLTPLLLDADPRVRRGTAQALTASRGFSLQPELEASLRTGIKDGAAPEALRELVQLLHRTGDASAFVVVAEALACEDRAVWEAVIRAGRVRQDPMHVGRLLQLLNTHPPLAPALLTLALAESERGDEGQREQLLALARKLVGSASAATLQRRALLAARALSGDETGLAGVLRGKVLAELKPLLKLQAKQAKDSRRERARLVGTLTLTSRILLEAASDPTALTKAIKDTPAEAWRGTLPFRARQLAVEAALADAPTRAPKGLLSALEGAASSGRSQGSPPPLHLLRSARDRLEPAQWLELDAALGSPDAKDVLRMRWVAELHGGELTADACRRKLKALTDEQLAQVEPLLLDAMEAWKPELREVLGDLIGELKRRKVDLQPQGWRGRRQAQERYARLVATKVRLGVRAGTDVLTELRPDDALGLLTAESDVAGLVALLEKDKKSINLIVLIGEAGGDDAARALAEPAKHPDFSVREAAAIGLGRCGAPEAARESLRALLSDDNTTVFRVALQAAKALEDPEHGGAVLRGLGHDDRNVFAAACDAALALKLEDARGLLVAALSDHARVEPAARALAQLGPAGHLDALLAALGTASKAAAADALGEAVDVALGEKPSRKQLDALGKLLGSESKHALRVVVKLIGAKGHTAAAPAVRGLLRHGSPVVRAAAYRAAADLGDAESFVPLRKSLDEKQDRRHPSRGAAFVAVARLAPEAEQDAIRALLLAELKEGRHAAAALEGLGALPPTPEVVSTLTSRLGGSGNGLDSEAFPLAFRALEQHDPEALGGAIESLRKLILTNWNRFPEAALELLTPWLAAAPADVRARWAETLLEAMALDAPQNWSTRGKRRVLPRVLLAADPERGAVATVRLFDVDPDTHLELLAEVCAGEHARPEWVARLRGALLSRADSVRRRAREALASLEVGELGAPFAEVLELARADDAACVSQTALLIHGPGGESLAGELLVALYRTETPAARAALLSQLGSLADRCWPGFKRVFKLVERNLDPELFSLQAWVLDQDHSWRNPSWRTYQYMQRRSYRVLKQVGLEQPERFMDVVEALVGRYGPNRARRSSLLPRLLREAPPASGPAQRFAQSKLENPFAEGGDVRVPDLIDRSEEELIGGAPPAPDAIGDPPAATPLWAGPLFCELWVRDVPRLIAMLAAQPNADVAATLLGLLEQHVGERLLEVELDAFYDLLGHASPAVGRFALSQIAARARTELVRFGALVPVFEAAVKASRLDWEAIADLLWVFDDERAEAERAGLAEPLQALITKHPGDPGVGPVVVFFRKHMQAKLAPPLFDWRSALTLVEAARPDVRELGRDLIGNLHPREALTPEQLRALLAATTLVEEAPDLVLEVLTASPARAGGYRPEAWGKDGCARAVETLPEPGYALLRRALLRFEDEGGLDPRFGLRLLQGSSSTRRGRTLGRELYGSALDRGAASVLDVTQLVLEGRHEDVVLWAGERVRAAAEAGKLPNEALYRLLDATAQDANRLARDLVREHLARFEAAELIVFCAESPDATTSELGISLYEERMRGPEGADYDLRALLPMFRILLFKVATARVEKTRLLGTLRRWALESSENAKLVTQVVAAFRRSEAKLDFTEAMRLMALLHDRFPEQVELPFAVATTFGYRRVT